MLYVLFVLAIIGVAQLVFIVYGRTWISHSSSNPTIVSRVPSHVNSQGVDTVSKCILCKLY